MFAARVSGIGVSPAGLQLMQAEARSVAEKHQIA
jgi:hypothetical protein